MTQIRALAPIGTGMSEAVAVAVIAALGSIISAYFAHKAERNSRPVSNGFAAGVNAKLDALAEQHAALHEDMREVRKTVIKHIAQDH